VVRVKDAAAGARAADKLIRSGAFGLVVLDLAGGSGGRSSRIAGPTIPPPLQSRLLALASKHTTAMVFLTEKKPDAPSLGSLVSLRAQAKRRRIQEGRYACDVEVVKDKRHGPGRSRPELCPPSWPDSWHGPAGLH
jgi:recombination protein RecA